MTPDFENAPTVCMSWKAQAAELQKCFEDFDPQKTGVLESNAGCFEPIIIYYFLGTPLFGAPGGIFRSFWRAP